jgi:precorrin-6B methylase 2
MMSVPGHDNRVIPELLLLMPPDARNVLEVGCGAGALAQAYRRINPKVCYLGIEKDPEAARASGRLDRVVGFDLPPAGPR